tara:strand:- start:1793 stop:1930 length:138 start_codon:yes stop_codon:yes gene_type:complete
MIILEVSEWIISIFLLSLSLFMIGIGLFLLSLFIFAIKDWFKKNG